MWKLHDFSITQILREINVGDSKSAKSDFSTNLETLNFDFFAFLPSLKAGIDQSNKIQNPKNGKKPAFLEL